MNIETKKEVSVGIFFRINKLFYYYTEPVSKFIGSNSDFYDVSLSHDRFFKILRPALNLGGLEYSDFPRGRVLYDRKKTIFRVYLDKRIFKEDELKERIIKKFGLEEQKYKFCFDEHYASFNQ